MTRAGQLGSDFGRLWAATATSQAGSAVAMGALPFVAVTVLAASTLQVSMLSAVAGLVSAALALPLGPWVEHRTKRPVMIAGNVLRAAALLSVPVAHVGGWLTYPHLLVVAVLASFGLLLELTASSAHLKALVPPAARTGALARLDTTSWLTASSGPAIGGVLLQWVGPTATLVVNAATFVLASLGLRTIRTPEPAPPARVREHHWRAEVTTGWRYIWSHPTLRPLFSNAMLFGAMVIASSPILAVFMLRDLQMEPWQYGLALGIPCLGGLAGAALAPVLERRAGHRDRPMLWLGVARTAFLLPIAFAPGGTAGMVLIVACETLMLLCAGAFNPLFAAHRFEMVPDHLMARTSAAWSITNRVLQPVATALAGLLAAMTSTRTAVLALGIGLLASSLLLPWRLLGRAAPPSADGSAKI